MNSSFNAKISPNKHIISKSSSFYLNLPKIQVIIRKRPQNKKELSSHETDIISIPNSHTIILNEQKTKVDLTKYIEKHTFYFDQTFNEFTSNEQIYTTSIRPLIKAAFTKSKITCFSYGQTGSGKTYTMLGKVTSTKPIAGMYSLACSDIFTIINTNEQYKNFSLYISFYEIYCGKLFDLLNNRNVLKIREDSNQNICIIGLTEKSVMTLKEMMDVIQKGINERTVGVTGANEDSSRSHGIIQIAIKDGSGLLHGKISFIDLAGSERASEVSETNRQTRIDGAEINKSLLALKECIRAIDKDKKHTPFRGSKLTLVLRDSFIGNCNTVMIANVSPCSYCSEHTLNTLRYADRVKEIRRLRGKSMNNREIEMQRKLNINLSCGNMGMFANEKEDNNKSLFVNINEVETSCITSKTIKDKKDTKVTNRSFIQSNRSMNNSFVSIKKYNNINVSEENKENICVNGYNDKGKKKRIIMNNFTNGNKREILSPFTTKASNRKRNNMSDALLFLNDYTTFNEKKRMQSKKKEGYENEMKELRKKYDSLIKQIAKVQLEYIELHKNHIDQMVAKLKIEMQCIETIEEEMNVKNYVDDLLSIFKFQEEKIAQMKKKLVDFKGMFNEEYELKRQIEKINKSYSPIISFLDNNEKDFNGYISKNIITQNYPVVHSSINDPLAMTEMAQCQG